MRLGKNLLAGLANSALTALVGLVATPGYLHFLGIERYGMVGVFLALQALLSLLDMGLSPTLNREVARSTASGDWLPVRGLFACLSRLYLGVAVVIFLVLLACSPWLASHWFRPESLAVSEIFEALVWMGAAIACRWPVGLYASVVNGAQRLTLSSSLASAYAVFSAAGALALLSWLEATLPVFFAWQTFAALAYALALRQAAWRAIGGRSGALAAWGELRRVWRFSAGMGLIAVTSVVFTQLDKVLLSRLLGLDAFGRYALATLVASGIYIIVTPIFNAIYPRYSVLVVAEREQPLWVLHRLGTNMMVALVFPLALVLGVMSQPLVALWTQDAQLSATVSPVVALLCAGTALHAVMFLPYALQLAHGLPRLAIRINLVLIVVLVPLMLSLTRAYGEVGAAAAWLTLHCLYLLLGTWVTHRHLFRGLGGAWLARDVGLPLLLTLLVGVLARWAGVQDAQGLLAVLGGAAATWLAGASACLAISPELRLAIRQHLPQWTGLSRGGKGADHSGT